MTLKELEAVVQRHLLLEDRQIIKLVCSFVIASRLPINPPWLFIVGPPSCGKTKLIESLLEVEGMVFIDNLTPRTFSSGMRGRDGKSNSLLENLLPNSTLLFSDFTTFIQKEEHERGEIVGQMRRIYDGKFENKTGSGIQTSWNGRLSILAGVTEEIYPSMGAFGAFGERWLLWDFIQPNDRAVAEIASHNLDDGPAKAEMTAAFAEFLNNFPLPETTQVDEITRKQIVDLSIFVCRARTQVKRKKYHHDNPIEMVFKPEQPPRLVKQILGFGLGLQALNGGQMNNDDRHLLCKMVLDSIPSIRRKCLQALTRYQEVETRALAKAMNYPQPETVRMHLQDLAAVGVIEYLTATNRDRWRLKDEYRTIMEVYDGIRPIGDILAEDEPAPVPPEMET